MSSISHKKPGFGPLNARRSDQTVGQTYGERREKTKSQEAKEGVSWLERAKDKFLGTKKTKDIKAFADKADQFLGAQRTIYSANPFVEKKSRLEEGTHLQSRIVHPAGDQYVRFLDSVIHYMNIKTAPKKA
ncbi:MAG: hypothetical protein HY609_07000 [Deltaproteobacteria bacterium]|nr:hypothetical protein [Deltaproteobacteria bacterium]